MKIVLYLCFQTVLQELLKLSWGLLGEFQADRPEVT